MLKGFIDNNARRIPLDRIREGNFGYMKEVVMSMAAKEIEWRNQPGDVHVTELVRPIRVTILDRRYGYYLDPMSMVDLWEGNVAHAELSRHNGELREHTIMKNIHGANVVGKIDIYNEGVLRDFKWTKIFTYKKCVENIRDNNSEYHWQINIYRWLLEQEGYEVKAQQLILRLKDWSATTWRSTDPPAPIMKVDVPFAEDVEKYLFDRVEAYLLFKGQTDDALPMCSDTQRYGRDKEGNWKRCKFYCNVHPFCEAIANNEQFNWQKGYDACKKQAENIDGILLQNFNVDDASTLPFRFQWLEVFSWLKNNPQRRTK